MLRSLPSCSGAPQYSLASLLLSDFSQGHCRTPSVMSLPQEQGDSVSGGCFSPCAGAPRPRADPGPLSTPWRQAADGLCALFVPCSTASLRALLRGEAAGPCPGTLPRDGDSRFELLSGRRVLTLGGCGAPSASLLMGLLWHLCSVPLAGHSDDAGSLPKLLQSSGAVSSCPVGCPPPVSTVTAPFHQISRPSSSLCWVTAGEGEFLVPRSCFVSSPLYLSQCRVQGTLTHVAEARCPLVPLSRVAR